MRLDAFVCSDIITTVMFDYFPLVFIEKALKNPFSKKRNGKFQV